MTDKSKKGYRAPVQQWPGYKTVVDQKSQLGILPSQLESQNDSKQDKMDSAWPVAPGEAREKERALPLPSDHAKQRDKKIGPTVYNKPRKVIDRTKSIPGEQYGHPTKYDYNYVRRRQDVTAALEAVASLFPDKRQNNQRSVSRRYTKNYYRIKKPQIQLKRQKAWRKKRLDPVLKRRKKMYRQYPQRYERRGQSPFNTPAERTKAWRKEQDQTARRKGLTRKEWEKKRKNASTLLAEALEILGANYPQNWNTHVKKTVPPGNLDQNFGKGKSRQTGTPRQDPSAQKGQSLRAPNLDNKPQKGLKWEILPKAPGSTMPSPQVNNPTSGSGKVLPLSWYTDLVNNTQAIPDGRHDRYLHNNNFEVKRAMVMAEILERTSPLIRERSKKEPPKLVRTDTKNWRWTWKVGKHTVKVQAFKRGSAKNFDKLNLKVRCSCPAWRWQGPEHWARQEGYLLGDTQGTASVPVIRDPQHDQPVCKHVYAVMQKSKKFFVRPEKSPLKKLSSQDWESVVRRVAARYLGRKAD